MRQNKTGSVNCASGGWEVQDQKQTKCCLPFYLEPFLICRWLLPCMASHSGEKERTDALYLSIMMATSGTIYLLKALFPNPIHELGFHKNLGGTAQSVAPHSLFLGLPHLTLQAHWVLGPLHSLLCTVLDLGQKP